MTWLRLAFANLGLSPLTSAVNVLLMTLGTASIVLLLLAGSQVSDTMSRDARGVDLVLGAKGSPVQLVLAAVYHADVPPGNIPLAAAERWAGDPRIARAVPLSLGDSYRGFRIVGTSAEIKEIYGAELVSGRAWAQTMEAVVGSAVAEAADLEVGTQFAGAHGLGDGGHIHDYRPYRVVGVLEPTGSVVDRLILTSLDSVWDLHSGDHSHDHEEHDDSHGDDAHDHEDRGHSDGENAHGHEGHDHSKVDEAHDHQDLDHSQDSDVHGHEEHDHSHGDEDRAHSHDEADKQRAHERSRSEITAMLLTYRSPMAAATLPRQVNADSDLQAAAPAVEVSRVLQLIGIGLDGLEAFAWVLIVTAGLSVFAALYGSLHSRRRDLATLRCLGATRSELLISLLLEGLLLSVIGVALGFAAGHVAMEILGGWLESARGVALTGWVWLPVETVLLLGLFAVGVIAAAIPAVQAYRTDPARTLSEN
ncbi:MAG: ABC transporter permease [Woeseiaceae bacterium]|nr:ABC transporter permease [Woeseiaceae bacterium]